MFCGAAGVTKAHVFAKSWTVLFDEPNDTREHEVVHRYEDPATGKRQGGLWEKAANSGY
jgi:hypothetical protein